MSNYLVMTDSTADFTPQQIEQLGIAVIPMEFLIEEKTYLNYPDGREITNEQFYAAMRGGIMPTTTQITTARFIEAFEPHLKQGKDLLYICFSSALSATYERSVTAVEELRKLYPQHQIYTVDSRSPSMGEGLLVMQALHLLQNGANVQQAAKWVEDNRRYVRLWFTVNDLNHLKRGGRISSAAALVGGMLGIKPVLQVNNNGELIPTEKIRGRKQSLDCLVSRMAESIEKPQEQTVYIMHGDALEDAQYVASAIREQIPEVKEVQIQFVGPIIGSHTGDGIMCVIYMGKERPI